MMQLLTHSGMTAEGWIFFGLSWGLIIGIGLFCYIKVLKKNGLSSRKK